MLLLIVAPELRRWLDFGVKRRYLALKLARLCSQEEEEEDVDDEGEQLVISLTVNRAHVLEESMQCFSSHTPEQLQRRMMEITFEDEEGVDAGGLTREWFMLVTREILRPSHGLFTQSADGVTCQPSPNSAVAVGSAHLQYFKFIGQVGVLLLIPPYPHTHSLPPYPHTPIPSLTLSPHTHTQVIGKAICDNHLLDVHLTRALYKHMLGVVVSYDDLEAFDLDYYRSLRTILEWPLEELGVELTFTAESMGLGELEVVELIPGGAGVEVTGKSPLCLMIPYP